MRNVIARWESKRGKDWVELYEQIVGVYVSGYGYESRNGGGWMGRVSREQAVSEIQRRVAAGCFCSQAAPMRKVV